MSLERSSHGQSAPDEIDNQAASCDRRQVASYEMKVSCIGIADTIIGLMTAKTI